MNNIYTVVPHTCLTCGKISEIIYRNDEDYRKFEDCNHCGERAVDSFYILRYKQHNDKISKRSLYAEIEFLKHKIEILEGTLEVLVKNPKLKSESE